jgi:hypothetical protein
MQLAYAPPDGVMFRESSRTPRFRPLPPVWLVQASNARPRGQGCVIRAAILSRDARRLPFPLLKESSREQKGKGLVGSTALTQTLVRPRSSSHATARAWPRIGVFCGIVIKMCVYDTNRLISMLNTLSIMR